MKLRERGFWTFEILTIVYAIVLVVLIDSMLMPTDMEYKLKVAGVCALSGVIAWLVGDISHWLKLAIVYEAVFISIISVIFWILVFQDNWHYEVTCYDFEVYFYLIIAIGMITFTPAMVLAFLAKRLSCRNGDNKKHGIK